MADLKKLDFPHAPHIALKQLEACLNGDDNDSAIPGLGPTKEELIEKLVEEHVFYRKLGRLGQIKKLSAIQELKLLDALNSFFQNHEVESFRHTMFFALFSQIPDKDRSDILARLISMGVGLQNKPLLECAAVWMQRHGCGTDVVLNLAQTLLQDYCVLVPNAIKTLKCLPNLSAHFTCNFITALTSLYSSSGLGNKNKRALTEMKKEIVEVIAGWIEKDPCVCLVSLDQSHSSYIQPQRGSLWTSPTKHNTQTPVPGLVRWCTQAPISHSLSCIQAGNDNVENTLLEQNHKMEQLWSKLHLSVLQTILGFPNLPGSNQLELITLADMTRIVKDIVALVREIKNKGLMEKFELATAIETAVDRVVQVLQVGLATGAFRCSLADLQTICKTLPHNRLLSILQSHHLTRTPPPMHHE